MGLHLHRINVRTLLSPLLWHPLGSFQQGAKHCKQTNSHLPSSRSSPSHSQLHNVMVHLQQENKKLKNEIEEKKLKTGNARICAKALGPCKLEPSQKGKICNPLGWRGIAQDVTPKTDITKYIGAPHCSGTCAPCFLLL